VSAQPQARKTASLIEKETMLTLPFPNTRHLKPSLSDNMLSDKSRQGPSNPKPGKAGKIKPIQTKRNFKALELLYISSSEFLNALKFLFKHKSPHADIHQQTDSDRSG
jgi:hypothetical protein